MIRVSEITKNYGPFQALKGISFEIEKGSVVGLLGPNGAGKTTTIRVLTTYLAPSSGTASVCGYDISKDPELVRRSIGYLPETPPLYPELRVEEYLQFVGRIRGLSGRKLKNSISREVDRCGLADVKDRLCGALSKGYRQRVGIAQALIHEPAVLILDEPTSGLDPIQMVQVRKLISELSQDHTVIVSTHILAEVSAVCSGVLILSDGQVAASGNIGDADNEESLEKLFFKALSGHGKSEEVQGVGGPSVSSADSEADSGGENHGVSQK